MLVENDELVWIYWKKMKEMDYEELVCDMHV